MRVLFVHPFFLKESRLERRLMTPYPPLGLLGLAAVAREAGHTVGVFDGTFRRPADFAPEERSFNPDVVCLGSLVTWRSSTLALGVLARESGTPVVIGGPDPTATPDAYLPPGGPADTVVLGEGEATLPDLDAEEVRRRWATMALPPGESLADP